MLLQQLDLPLKTVVVALLTELLLEALDGLGRVLGLGLQLLDLVVGLALQLGQGVVKLAEFAVQVAAALLRVLELREKGEL